MEKTIIMAIKLKEDILTAFVATVPALVIMFINS